MRAGGDGVGHGPARRSLNAMGWARFPVMALALLALLAALWGGLVRIGWELPPLGASLVSLHGPVMVLGFLGTLIALERAAALRAPWAFASAAASGLGGLGLLLGLPLPAAQVLLAAGGAGLVAIFGVIYRLQPALHTATLGAGAALSLAGSLLWLAGLPIYRVVPWWVGFLVLTIAGERLELARIGRPSRGGQAVFVAANGLFVAGLLTSLATYDAGVRIAGAGLAAQAIWLAIHDIARRTVGQRGLTRFIAVCLLAGYVWLGVGGLLWLWFGGAGGGAAYDAMLHAVFVGFVMSMIFGHAPVIIPGVLGGSIPFRPAFYAHLALLHASLLLRVAGDLASDRAPVRWGGMLNAVAVLLFLTGTARAVRQGARARRALTPWGG